MCIEQIKSQVSQTPAFVYDETTIHRSLSLLDGVRSRCGLKFLFSIKALPFAEVIKLTGEWVDGFSVSSLFEAKLASKFVKASQSLHITSPGLHAGEIGEIAKLCKFISFNSLPQYQRLKPYSENKASWGLRVNPQRSFLDDVRYDPCRQNSKLGIPINQLKTITETDPDLFAGVEGIHVHNMYSSTCFQPLSETLKIMEAALENLFSKLKWINIGGGYLFDGYDNLAQLEKIVSELKRNWDVEVFFEPGSAIVRDCGFLITSVVDVFENDSTQIAILDTSVNHLPEVFEYQTSPVVSEAWSGAAHNVILAGSTCLSGDIFGEYQFPKPLNVGDRLTFQNVGAYTLIKAHRFNGYNLPALFARDRHGEVHLKKRFTFEDYRQQWV